MTLIGPNCSGFLTQTYKGKFAGIIPKQTGAPVDFNSGSGAAVDYVMERSSSLGLSFGTVINLGNSVQMGVANRGWRSLCCRIASNAWVDWSAIFPKSRRSISADQRCW